MRLPKNPFLKAGEFLVKVLGLDRPGRKNRELCQEINTLAAGKKDAVSQYYAKKLADVLLVFAVLAGITLVIFLTTDRKGQMIEDHRLDRPGYGMGDREEELAVRMEGESETERLSVIVQERKYTQQEAEKLLQKGRDQLEKELAGENESLDEVRKSLKFPVSLENGAVKVEWMTMPYGIIGDDGSITGQPEERGSIVEIQATLSCQGYDLVYETAVCVYPPVLSEEEQKWQSLRAAVKQADEDGASQEILLLPDTVGGKRVTWGRPSSDYFPLLLALTLLLPVCIALQKDQKVRQKAKERRLQLEMDYPDLMWKMTMLLGAGLTIRGTFSKIAAEYRKETIGEIHYVYEEMLYTCYEMKSGTPESVAYEHFGRRCELPKYIKLGSLLSQNLKKGSKGLVSILEKEALSSMEERKNIARKLGEEAGTRLLFPMILLFGVVLIILIVPAFLSF